MNEHWLNLNQSPAELDAIHGDRDYYWYLRSDAFRKAFFAPMAALVRCVSLPPVAHVHGLLDVGCGEGVMADVLPSPVQYVGIDGSRSAILKARGRQRFVPFYVDRLEDPREVFGQFDIVLFGGVMEVLVKPEFRVELMEMYRSRFGAKVFIVFDLERLDTSLIEARWGKPIHELHAVAEGVETEEVKLYRKILMYEARP